LKAVLEAEGLAVRYVEPNDTLYATTMHPSQEWHYEMIHAPEAWTVEGGSSSTIVAVLDTGIDYTHDALQNYVDTGLGKSYTGTTFMDGHGHGTHVAGTIASYGVVSGVMQIGKLVPVKVLTDEGSGSTDDITAAIIYAAEIGADVINMSLGGGGYNSAMADACSFAVSEGTVVVAASGNDSAGTISYPAAYPGVIAVGAVDSTGARAYYSNYGTGLDVMAPGSNIYSCKPGDSYTTMSGTSMATPHVAGVVGLIRSANPSISVAEVTSILMDTATYAGSATYYGSGIVNAYAAVQAALGGGTEPPPDDYYTTTTLTTNKAIYAPGEVVTITATVKDQDGYALSGATVAVTLTTPSGSTASGSATTNTSGVATLTYTTTTSTAVGTYGLTASTTMSGYDGSTASASFKIQATGTVGTSTVVTTNRTSYSRGSYVYITATVRRTDTNALLYGATVNITLTKPNGTTMSTTKTTNSSGVVTWTLSTSYYTPVGTYSVRATTSMTGFTGSTATTAFSVY